MFKFIENIKTCNKYSEMIPLLETMYNGDLLDVIEAKVKIDIAKLESLNEYSANEKDLYASLLLLKNDIENLKESRCENNHHEKDNHIIEIKIAIAKILNDII